MTEQTKKWTPEPWEVRVWDGDQWPERRVSLAAKGGRGRAIAISPRYVSADQSLSELSRAAACVNALQGIANPSAVREVIEAARFAVPDLDGPNWERLYTALEALGQDGRQA